LGRLIAAATAGPQWGLSWTYDGFGNRLAQNVTKGSGPVVSLTVDPFTNRISTFGFSYDAAGHLVQWPGGTVTIGAGYDVEGRMSRVVHNDTEQEKYFYNARNLRVKNKYSPLRVYGLGGELLGEYLSAPAGLGRPQMVRERIYFAGQLVGTVEGDGSWSMPATDRLGSLKQGSRRYPFGDGNESYANDEYATYRKDHASAHYYAWHRWYSATWGRFSSPDPFVMSGGLTNPQGWNRYSYVANDPVNFHDPTGLVAAATKFDDPTLACMLGMPFWLSYDYAFVLCSGGGGWGGAGPVTYPSPGVERGGGGGPAPPRVLMPKLTPERANIAIAAIGKAAEMTRRQTCDSALKSYGVDSLSSLLQGIRVDGDQPNVFDGMSSSYPKHVGDNTVSMAEFFRMEKHKVAAEVVMTGSASTNVMFLGPAFFNPGLAGVDAGYYGLAQAFIMMHEAVHLVGNILDSDFGGSKKLTKLLVDNCFPVHSGKLGGLYK